MSLLGLVVPINPLEVTDEYRNRRYQRWPLARREANGTLPDRSFSGPREFLHLSRRAALREANWYKVDGSKSNCRIVKLLPRA